MTELFTFWLAGFCTGVAFTGGLAGWFRPRMGPPRGSNGNCVPMPPSTPAPGYRRVYLRSLSRVVNCDGPCKAGPEYCDCGLMWHDVPRLDPGSIQRGNGRDGPATPKPDIIPGDTP